MFFGKIHHNRDTAQESDGNMHAHLIISRKSMDGSLKLSPLANQRQNTGSFRGGFCRSYFYAGCEERFDDFFGYSRPLEKKYFYHNINKNGELWRKIDLHERVYEERYQRERQRRNDAALWQELYGEREKSVPEKEKSVEQEKSIAETGISLALGLINDEPQQVQQYVPDADEKKKKKQKRKGIRYW
jgi:hypothetical protein